MIYSAVKYIIPRAIAGGVLAGIGLTMLHWQMWAVMIMFDVPIFIALFEKLFSKWKQKRNLKKLYRPYYESLNNGVGLLSRHVQVSGRYERRNDARKKTSDFGILDSLKPDFIYPQECKNPAFENIGPICPVEKFNEASKDLPSEDKNKQTPEF